MESFYDREEGIAWGPVTKQEIFDDLLFYKPSKPRHRHSVNCNPSFMEEIEERLSDITLANTPKQSMAVNDEAVIVLSDEDENRVDHNEIITEITNKSVCHLDIENRSLTPANIDENTFDESLDDEDNKFELEELKLVESSYNTHSKTNPIKSSIHLEENTEIYGDRYKNEERKSFVLPGFKITSSMNLEDDEKARSTLSEEIGIVQSPTKEYEDVFNDTLSEMERLLNEGLNYTMQTDKSYLDGTASNKPLNETNEDVMLKPLLDIPVIVVQTDVAVPETTPSYNFKGDKDVGTLNKPSLRKKTKIPIAPMFHSSKPTSKPVLTPTYKPVLTPTNRKYMPSNPLSGQGSSKKRFNYIESPISLYIKNSGVTPLYKKVTPSKQLSCNKNQVPQRQIEKTNKENSLVFPEVIYKPAKRTIVRELDNFKLPKNIESLIPQKPNIIRHEGHIGGSGSPKVNQSFINKKLCEPDLTIDSNASLDCTGDISLHCSKRAFITKNSFK